MTLDAAILRVPGVADVVASVVIGSVIVDVHDMSISGHLWTDDVVCSASFVGCLGATHGVDTGIVKGIGYLGSDGRRQGRGRYISVGFESRFVGHGNCEGDDVQRSYRAHLVCLWHIGWEGCSWTP